MAIVNSSSARRDTTKKPIFVHIRKDDIQSRVKSGEYVIISPDHPPVVGEEVLITMKDGGRLVRDFVAQRDGQLIVENIRGEQLSIPATEVASVEYVTAIHKRDPRGWRLGRTFGIMSRS